MAEFTERDALLAEILGDVGTLLKAVNLLEEILPNQTEEAVKHLTEIIGSIEKAGDTYKLKADTYTEALLEESRAQLDKEIQAARQHFEKNVNDAINKTITGYENTVETKFTNPVKSLLNSIQQSQHGLMEKLLYAFIGGLIGGITGVVCITLLEKLIN
jgi:F0F1-type ATP synthase membrane subunit b/b'